MKNIYNTPLEQTVTKLWNRIGNKYKNAFFVVVGINILAFGFEMTNLTLHHDDVAHIFIQDDILGHYLGRFGFGWLHYYTQNAYIMPFLQAIEGVLLMSIYGLLIAYYWGAKNTLDLILVSSIVCVFPYMAQINQYNTSMFPFALAHLLAASAVILSTRATLYLIITASLLYMAAFSIYQSVLANAATIFCVWLLGKILFLRESESFFTGQLLRSAIAALLSVLVGGIIYLAIVSSMDLRFDSYQAAGQAFDFKDNYNLVEAIKEILHGTRSFFFWPENYFSIYLVKLQLLLVLCVGVICLWLPKSFINKVTAVFILLLAIMSPRILQFIHPEGTYHNLTLTSYAVLIAGSVMVINRAGSVLMRNLSVILAMFLVAGYILQCNWISTVNYLNTLAHYTTMTQLLARIRTLPGESWDGKKIAVVGNYKMASEYPFKSATGVAVNFIDSVHMQHLAKLMREDVSFIQAGEGTPGAMKYAEANPSWPHPDSIGVVDGMGVVVLSKQHSKTQ